MFASAGFAALFLLAGCQVSGTTSQSILPSQNQAIVVTVSPGSGSVQTGMSFQFTASVQGDSANNGVTWSIQSSPGCDCGTIDSTGKYFAPQTAHVSPGLVISATSVSDPTKSGTAIVYVTPAPSQSSIAVTVSPGTGSVQTGMSFQFTASVQGDSANKGVTWSIQSPPGCDCGTIDSTGKYFAPQTAHVSPGLVISATSVSDPTKSATAVILVTPAPTGPIVVTVSPGTGSVQVGMSFQFTATVQGDPGNQGVTWSIQSPPGCDCGTIDSTGKYFAPQTPHVSPGLVISATSVSDPTKSATAIVYVTPAPSQSVIAVTISPNTGSVQVGMSFQFTASVQGDSGNNGVTWLVQPPPGCDCATIDCGSIDSTGKYFASKTPHVSPGLVISATSVSDPSKSATAVIFVTPAPEGGVGVFPAVAVVPVNGTQQFNATGSLFYSFPVVTWTVSGNGCLATSCGTIDSTGIYTAPATPPTPANLKITATSVADPTVVGFADVTVGNPGTNSDNAKLNGHYAFLLRGYDGDGDTTIAGSFVADGQGNISSGIADYVFIAGLDRVPAVTLTGTYSVSSDNRASITITSGTSRNTTFLTQTFTLALESFSGGVANRGRMVEVDNEEIWVTGLLARQDPTAFSTAAVTGSYAFGFGGAAYSGWPLTTAGRFTAAGGTITAGLADVYGVGLAENGAGTIIPEPRLPFTGLYDVSSNGRGTAILNGLPYYNFSFYVISADELFFIELETCTGFCSDKSEISGTALRQSGGPYSAGSLNGTSVFNLTSAGSGVSNSGTVAVGLNSFGGDGTFSETREMNNAGVITTASTATGTYSVDTDGLGRGLINLPGSSQPRPFYLVSPGKAFVMDLGSYEAGSFEPQAGGPFGDASFSGNYGAGTLPWDFNWVFNPTSGVLTADGAGNLTGTIDGKGGTGISMSGNYSVASNGRTTTQIGYGDGSTSNWVFYPVSPSKAVGIEVTPGTVNSAIRIIEK
jgi:hypothetical protein